MKCAIIDKNYSESERKKGTYAKINKMFPDEYPMHCIEKEFNSLEDAKRLYPDKHVMSVEDYNSFIKNMASKHKDLLIKIEIKKAKIHKKPFWRFW